MRNTFNFPQDCFNLEVKFNKEVEIRKAMEAQFYEALPIAFEVHETEGIIEYELDFIPNNEKREYFAFLVESAKNRGLLDYGYRRIKNEGTFFNKILKAIKES